MKYIFSSMFKMLASHLALLTVTVAFYTPSYGSPSQQMYEAELKNTNAENCKKDPKSHLYLVQKVVLGSGATDAVLEKIDPEKLKRKKKLRKEIDKVDASKFCDCRSARVKSELSADDYEKGSYLKKIEEITMTCLEKSISG